MALAALRIGAWLVGLASAMQITDQASGEQLILMQLSVDDGASAEHTVIEASGDLMEGAPESPEWCRNETNMTWKQRKERMQQHATLEWAKQQARKLREANETVPGWMDKMVTEDENRGKLKWAVQEAKRLKDGGKEVPEWMGELVAENDKWANRWAACKAAELRTSGEVVPEWMSENGRKGLMEYATEKSHELQEQIDELTDMQSREEALVQAGGSIKLARQRLNAGSKRALSKTPDQQIHVLEVALSALGDVERKAGLEDQKPVPKLKQAAMHAKAAYETLGRVLKPKLDLIIRYA